MTNAKNTIIRASAGSGKTWRLSNRFLPDKLRQSLSVFDNRRRGARDAHALNVLMETRKQAASGGPSRVLFIAGRRSVEENALRPSRFFFMSKDIQKTALRVQEYFKEMEPRITMRLIDHQVKFRTTSNSPTSLEPQLLLSFQYGVSLRTNHLKHNNIALYTGRNRCRRCDPQIFTRQFYRACHFFRA